MNHFWIEWKNEDGLWLVPILATGCRSFEEAESWAINHSLPKWATDDTEFRIWRGRPGLKDSPQALFTVKSTMTGGMG
jgi:hypothetical protein